MAEVERILVERVRKILAERVLKISLEKVEGILKWIFAAVFCVQEEDVVLG